MTLPRESTDQNTTPQNSISLPKLLPPTIHSTQIASTTTHSYKQMFTSPHLHGISHATLLCASVRHIVQAEHTSSTCIMHHVPSTYIFHTPESLSLSPLPRDNHTDYSTRLAPPHIYLVVGKSSPLPNFSPSENTTLPTRPTRPTTRKF